MCRLFLCPHLIHMTTDELLRLGEEIASDPTCHKMSRLGRPLGMVEMSAILTYSRQYKRRYPNCDCGARDPLFCLCNSKFEEIKLSSLILYEKLNQSPAEALKFVDQIGQSLVGFGGIANPNQGKVVALVCLTEGIPITGFAKKYHLMEKGKLQHTSVYLHAEMIAQGWKVKWLKDGSNGEASAQFTNVDEGVDQAVSFSMEDAKRAKLVKPDGGWEKQPANMLRARVISNACVMLAPGIISGHPPDMDYDEGVISANEQSHHRETVVETVEAETVIEQPATSVNEAQAEVAAGNVELESNLANGPYDPNIYQEVRDVVAKFKANEIGKAILERDYDGKPLNELANLPMRKFLIELYAEVLGLSDKFGAALSKVGCDSFETITIAQANQMLKGLQGMAAKK